MGMYDTPPGPPPGWISNPYWDGLARTWRSRDDDEEARKLREKPVQPGSKRDRDRFSTDETERWTRTGYKTKDIDFIEPLHVTDSRGNVHRYTLTGQKIPDGWQDVRINADPDAELQAMGAIPPPRENKPWQVKKVYSKPAITARHEVKHARVSDFDRSYDDILRQAYNDMGEQEVRGRRDPGNDVALAIGLLGATGLRPGNPAADTRGERTHGILNLERRHLKLKSDDEFVVEFTGKDGVLNKATISDPQLVQALKERDAFSAVDADGRQRPDASGASERDPIYEVSSARVRNYLGRIGYRDFNIKDFRTRIATNLARELLEGKPDALTPQEFKQLKYDVASQVAERLSNSPEVALGDYIDPSLWSRFEENLKPDPTEGPRTTQSTTVGGVTATGRRAAVDRATRQREFTEWVPQLFQRVRQDMANSGEALAIALSRASKFTLGTDDLDDVRPARLRWENVKFGSGDKKGYVGLKFIDNKGVTRQTVFKDPAVWQALAQRYMRVRDATAQVFGDGVTDQSMGQYVAGVSDGRFTGSDWFRYRHADSPFKMVKARSAGYVKPQWNPNLDWRAAWKPEYDEPLYDFSYRSHGWDGQYTVDVETGLRGVG